jgi:hypothetical protein
MYIICKSEKEGAGVTGAWLREGSGGGGYEYPKPCRALSYPRPQLLPTNRSIVWVPGVPPRVNVNGVVSLAGMFGTTTLN